MVRNGKPPGGSPGGSLQPLQRRSRNPHKNRAEKMVCLACLLPIFLIPVVNALPLLFDFIVGRIYRLLGWEYRKPERAPPACPYKPAVNKNTEKAGGTQDNNLAEVPTKTSPHEDDKQE